MIITNELYLELVKLTNTIRLISKKIEKIIGEIVK